MRANAAFDIVIPTIGRSSLGDLLVSIERSTGPRPASVVVVDDRREACVPLDLPETALRVTVVRGEAAGPASARNVGWRNASSEWVAFIDDDVIVDADWLERLAADLGACGTRVAATQGTLRVPLPRHRAPTDWERNVASLASAQWITADCAYRRAALADVGGFDVRFPRAYREDADLALRVVARGWTIERGARTAVHPVPPADAWISVRLQRGNADDALMRALHGDDWYDRAGATRGAFRSHLFAVACGLGAFAFGALWAGATARFAWQRIAPGPKTPRELATMAATSAAIPFAAVAHRIAGERRARRLTGAKPRVPAAVLLDRDGTLIVDVPFNGDPDRVEAMPGARAALDRLRAAGVALAVVTNQGGLADGRLDAGAFQAVNARIEALLGPLGPWCVCPHASDDGCTCRKPQAGLVFEAARTLGVEPQECVVIGDIGSDVEAARAAGAEAILVPTAITLPGEIARAPRVAQSLGEAVDLVLAGMP